MLPLCFFIKNENKLNFGSFKLTVSMTTATLSCISDGAVVGRVYDLANPSAFDASGYDSAGFDKMGFNREGFNGDGFNKDGYDRNG